MNCSTAANDNLDDSSEGRSGMMNLSTDGIELRSGLLKGGSKSAQTPEPGRYWLIHV
jgi:hypothetical protein